MENKQDENLKTNFGFKKVSFAEKKNLVNDVFSNVAIKYDLMNDIMSFGLHRLWKTNFCRYIPDLNSTILDVACGTGDIALKLKELAKKRNKTANFVTACDINEEMLQIAKNKAIDKNILDGIDFICADAENLPFAENSFDYYTIVFGIRNVANIPKALKEAYRVLKPMGKFLCLEFSKIEPIILKKIYDFYALNIIPKIGQIVASNKDAYQYLSESIELFPEQETFKIMIKDAGFNKVNYHNFNFGVAAIHYAYKL